MGSEYELYLRICEISERKAYSLLLVPLSPHRRKSEKDKEITRLKRELNKVNNDLAKKKEELKSTRSELRGLKAENNKKKEQTIRLTEEQSRLLSELLGDTSITNS